LGCSRQETARGNVHFYYHHFLDDNFPDACGTDKIDRGKTCVIHLASKLRDDMIIGMRMLSRLDLIEHGYCCELEDRWLDVQPKTIVDNGVELVLYQRDRYVEESLRRGISPVHKFVNGVRCDPKFLEGFHFGAHLSTNVKLVVGDVVCLQRGFGNAISIIYKEGRAYANFKRLNSYIGVVTEVLWKGEDDFDVIPYGPFWREGSKVFYRDEDVSIAYFRYLNRVIWWSMEEAKLYLEKCCFVQDIVNGLPVLDRSIRMPKLKRKGGFLRKYEGMDLPNLIDDVNKRFKEGEEFPGGHYSIGGYLVFHPFGSYVWQEDNTIVPERIKLGPGLNSKRVVLRHDD